MNTPAAHHPTPAPATTVTRSGCVAGSGSGFRGAGRGGAVGARLRLVLSFLALGLTCGMAVLAWAADPPPSGTPSPRRPALVVLGDSIASGFGVDPSEAFPAVLQSKLTAAGIRMDVVNAGVSGDTTSGGLRRIDWVLRRPMDILLLELGGNDGLRGIPPDATRTNLLGIIERARKRNPRLEVVVAGMLMPPNMGAEYTNAFQKVFPAVAKEAGATLVPFLLEGVGGVPALNQPDQIHPTAEGHRRIAETVWKAVEPVVRRVAAGP